MKIYILLISFVSLFLFSCSTHENVQIFIATEDLQLGTNRFSVAFWHGGPHDALPLPLPLLLPLPLQIGFRVPLVLSFFKKRLKKD